MLGAARPGWLRGRRSDGTREAVRALERAVAGVAAHYPHSVDARRLQSDVARVAEDLHLLVGQDAASARLNPLGSRSSTTRSTRRTSGWTPRTRDWAAGR